MSEPMNLHRVYLDGDDIRDRTIPNTLSLPLYPPVRAAEEAVINIMKNDFSANGETARRRIRVEISRDVEMELRAHISPSNLHLIHDHTQVGPMQIMGVSYYIVDRLPEPGWRVIS